MATSSDNDRLFDPGRLRFGPRSCMKYYPASGLTFKKSQVKSTLSTTLIVGVDGACPDNGPLANRGSWGVYFGRNSPYNSCGLLPKAERKTNNVAEIYAALNALKLVSQRVILGPREVKELVIMSDSALLVSSLTDYIKNWRKNGFKTVRKQSVANVELIKELDDLVDEVEMTLGLQVKFWHVKRKYNAGADRLANIALDNDVGWTSFWLNQLAGEPKSIVSDLLSVRSSTLDIMGPLLLCLEYPLTGKGEWNSSLRAFHILQAITKVNRLSLSEDLQSQLRDGLLAAIVGPNWRNRANRELEKFKEKVDIQNSLMQNAIKKFYETDDDNKRKFAVIPEVNNHLIMAIISRSLKVPFVEQNEHFTSLIERYLSNDSKWDVSKKFRSFISIDGQSIGTEGRNISRPTQVAGPTESSNVASRSEVEDLGILRPAEFAGSPSPKVVLVERQTTISEDPSSSRPTEPAGGVRLDWREERDDWVEIDYPSS
ncbi:uncharacterized protein PAC_03632 [Phialocephala subalpina]|uniref:ribonuclease H n=1 Tax=Phialocephala subalpina TaxID=576137 RepID=A0A1L7WLV4_9HELO|nr:uncharacterized protein PAC_03632 [Phialocephala subalpina]